MLLGLEIYRRRRSSHERRIELCPRRMRPRELAPHDCHGLTGIYGDCGPAERLRRARGLLRRQLRRGLGNAGPDRQPLPGGLHAGYPRRVPHARGLHLTRTKSAPAPILPIWPGWWTRSRDISRSQSETELRSQAETNCARLALHYAGRLWHFEGDREASNRQLDGALRLSDDDEIRRGAEALRAAMATGERNPS